MAYYITGDCHGNLKKIGVFCRHHRTNLSDVLILLGDVGVNFNLDDRDRKGKQFLAAQNITFFCIHGNHEERPFNIPSYQEKEFKGGMVYYEPEYPNLLFAKDGEIYDFNKKKVIVIGGAYSIDKQYRITYGYPWFSDEQPSPEIREFVERSLQEAEWTVDYVFSHTCPLKYQPTDLFLKGYEQSDVDTSTEEWLTALEADMKYQIWYFGHYHGNRDYERAIMLYEEIRELGERKILQKLGCPKYRMDETVVFSVREQDEREVEKKGKISVVDAYGTYRQAREVSYDILVTEAENKTLYKRIGESQIKEAKKADNFG